MTAQGATPSSLISTVTYGYTSTWGDKLTSYAGTSITYDSMGNPLSYHNGNDYTFTWENGRRLKSASMGSYTLSFKYNDEGIRTSKTVNGTEHIYRLEGSKIISESWGDLMLIYLYDAEGVPVGMQYRTTSMAEGTAQTYWYEKNLQGDVVAVYNASGTKLISYSYDAWGNVTMSYHNGGAATSARHNPFTYRGYYYDDEIGLYYLQSRYYDPATGRFLNADGVEYLEPLILIGLNSFAYCGNNPIARYDPSGHLWDYLK